MFLILLIAWLVTLMPFLFWKATWFGNRLSDRQIGEYLNDKQDPRRSQHALSQISDRLSHGDHSVNQFFSQVVLLADSPSAELRMTTAWVMGQDNTFEPFHQALLKLVRDEDPLVRWNAALGLVRFSDTTGRSALHEILHPVTVFAPASGVFKERLKPDDAVNRGALLARIERPGSTEAVEVRSPIPGRIRSQLLKDGAEISIGTAAFTISPDEKEVWEALRAFFLVGDASDLPDIQPFAQSRGDMPVRIQRQARLALEAIQRRAHAQQ
jgi:hypothetical protein